MIQSRFVTQDQLIDEWGAVVIQKPYSVEGLGRKVREGLDKQDSISGLKKDGLQIE
jgi:hypothetical protein